MQYELEEFDIMRLRLCRLKDENGEYWYPLTNFLTAVLFRDVSASEYRDNEKYNKFMKVIPYIHPKSPNKNKEQKTWFISQEGLYTILSNIKIMKRNVPSDAVREKYLMAARALVGVPAVSDTGLFISYQPSLQNYDIWSTICIENDPDIGNGTLWKKCAKCGFYYPNTDRYYKNTTAPQCLQCKGEDFICKNKRLQYIYKHNGTDLLYALNQKTDEEIGKEFRTWVRQGGML